MSLLDHSSNEKKILIEVLNNISNIDSYWISTLIENYVFLSETKFTETDKWGCTYNVKAQLRNNKFHGIFEEFFQNGKLKKVCFYNDGIKHGPCLKFYSNGNIFSTSFFENGNLDGELIGYFNSGKIKFKIIYKNGHSVSNLNLYYPTGKIKQSISFINNTNSCYLM
jgi:antitoxin component YwqK of YwqJK toxin-antitoxin module